MAAGGSGDGAVPSGPTTAEGIPIIDLGLALSRGESEEAEKLAIAESKRCADAFHRFGLAVVRDPRVSMADNDRFLNMLERYFEQPRDEKMKDVRKDLSYQVGTTPDFVELPRNHCDRMLAYKETDKPLSECPPEKDAKWRFFWRIGDRPSTTEFEDLNAEAVIPAGFPEWKDVMNTWGEKLLTAAMNVAELTAEGLGLAKDAISSKMQMGPHLLAPTATDLYTHGKVGVVAAGFHSDLNLFTVHGKSRFAALSVWARDGRKIAVKVPDGCLLVQAGQQAEYITGGHILAGFHEVIVGEATLRSIEKAKEEGRSLWRISSTLFSHVASDVTLEPIGPFADIEGAKERYPPIKTGTYVQRELDAIKLGVDADKEETKAES